MAKDESDFKETQVLLEEKVSKTQKIALVKYEKIDGSYVGYSFARKKRSGKKGAHWSKGWSKSSLSEAFITKHSEFVLESAKILKALAEKLA